MKTLADCGTGSPQWSTTELPACFLRFCKERRITWGWGVSAFLSPPHPHLKFLIHSGIFFVFLIYLFTSMNMFRKKNPYLFQKWKSSIPSHKRSQDTQGRDVRGAPSSVTGALLTCLSAVPKLEAGFLIMSSGRGY